MNKYATILFEMLKSDIDAHVARLTKRVVRSCAAKRTTSEVRRTVEAQIREVLELQAWGFLCLFDNVGCRLPSGVLGYQILATPEIGKAGKIQRGRPAEIRDGEDDYSDMWLGFCLAREAKKKDGT